MMGYIPASITARGGDYMAPKDDFQCNFDWLKTVIENLDDKRCTKIYTADFLEWSSRRHEHVEEANMLSSHISP